MSSLIIKKNPASRLASYILLLPFIPAVRPLLARQELSELIVFGIGFVLTLLMIIYSNSKPYVRVADKNLYINLLYRYKPEIHKLSSIEKIQQKSSRSLILETSGFDPLEIKLRKKEMKKLIARLEEENLVINTTYRNS